MGIWRDTDKDKVVRATLEDLKQNGVDLTDDDNATIQRMTVAELEAVGRWLGHAWSHGFNAGRNQPDANPDAKLSLALHLAPHGYEADFFIDGKEVDSVCRDFANDVDSDVAAQGALLALKPAIINAMRLAGRGGEQ